MIQTGQEDPKPVAPNKKAPPTHFLDERRSVPGYAEIFLYRANGCSPLPTLVIDLQRHRLIRILEVEVDGHLCLIWQPIQLDTLTANLGHNLLRGR